MPFSLPPRRFSSLAWLGVILLLVGIIGTELGWGSRVRASLPQPKPQKTRPAVLPLLPDFDLLPLDRAYTETLTRPLFVPGRHSLWPQAVASSRPSSSASRGRAAAPPPPPKPQAPEVVEEAPREVMRKGQFVLDGIIIAQGKNIALLREMSTRKTVRAELGEEINGMLVEQIEPDRITFKLGEEREVLILKVKTGPKAPAKPASQSVGVPVQQVVPAAPSPATPGSTPAAAAAPAPAAAVPEFIERRRARRNRPPAEE